ncbi:hypothetical protein KOY49_01730 [Candidatus Minimicrobia vallesae]|uniref:PAS domain-containing protein n=1 Tax=Candidatus Minimicrobia vallesae TaxID=2841264 RepID=A0A8F1MAB7_9BACT|nr:hypothetical protein [Candidatus Minimicrobia vallesae]QWQ31710.1 hypothetical protein KOY49_01730 [Candidatus Minimicrobia vallesae]
MKWGWFGYFLGFTPFAVFEGIRILCDVVFLLFFGLLFLFFSCLGVICGSRLSTTNLIIASPGFWRLAFAGLGVGLILLFLCFWASDVLGISKDGNIELINPSAQQIIGWDQGDALGLNWKSVLKLVTSDGKDVEDLENPIAQSLSKNQPTHNDKLFLLTSSEN